MAGHLQGRRHSGGYTPQMPERADASTQLAQSWEDYTQLAYDVGNGSHNVVM